MIGQKQHHGHHATVAVEQAGAGIDEALGLHETALISRQATPLQATFTPTGTDDFGDAWQAHHVTDALHIGHVVGECVDVSHDVMIDTSIRRCLGNDIQNVRAN